VETGTIGGLGFGDAYAVGYLVMSMNNNVQISELSFELDFSPNILIIQTADVSGRATADSVIVTENFIELVNPVIPSGNGEIMMFTVFANTGSDGSVNINFDEITANDDSANQVCITVEEGEYIVNTIEQIVMVDSATAEPAGFALVGVNIENNIPLKMFMITINDSPDYLTPIEEFYTDVNQNGQYDEGEMYTDFNGDGEWTPFVQTTERTANWDLSYQLSDVGIMVAGLNSIDSIAVGAGPIFKINYLVDGGVPSTNVNMLLASVNLTDIFGNYNLQYIGSNGVFVITALGTEDETIIPETFSMSTNYPNPFNPLTHVDFDVPEQSNVSFSIYSLLGQQVLSISSAYQPGSYKFTWNGRDQMGNALPSGVYILKMESESFLKTRKLVLMK